MPVPDVRKGLGLDPPIASVPHELGDGALVKARALRRAMNRMPHHRRDPGPACPVEEERPVVQGPKRVCLPPHPGELELGAIPLASRRDFDARCDLASSSSGPPPTGLDPLKPEVYRHRIAQAKTEPPTERVLPVRVREREPGLTPNP